MSDLVQRDSPRGLLVIQLLANQGKSCSELPWNAYYSEQVKVTVTKGVISKSVMWRDIDNVPPFSIDNRSWPEDMNLVFLLGLSCSSLPFDSSSGQTLSVVKSMILLGWVSYCLPDTGKYRRPSNVKIALIPGTTTSYHRYRAMAH